MPILNRGNDTVNRSSSPNQPITFSATAIESSLRPAIHNLPNANIRTSQINRQPYAVREITNSQISYNPNINQSSYASPQVGQS